MNNPAIAAGRIPATVAMTGRGFVPAPGRRAGLIRRVGSFFGDGLLLLAVVFAIPIVILAVGIPAALVVQLLLWIGRQL